MPLNDLGADITTGLEDRAAFALQNNIAINTPGSVHDALIQGAIHDANTSAIADFIETEAANPQRAKLAGLDNIPEGETLLSPERMHDFTLAKLKTMAGELGLSPENTITFAKEVVASGKTAITESELSNTDIEYLTKGNSCEVASPSCPDARDPSEKGR